MKIDEDESPCTSVGKGDGTVCLFVCFSPCKSVPLSKKCSNISQEAHMKYSGKARSASRASVNCDTKAAAGSGLVVQSCLTLLQLHSLEPARLLCPWDFLGKNTGVGCHFLLQGTLLSAGIEPSSPALADGFFITEPPDSRSVISFLAAR